MKIIFWGTPEYSIKTLEVLIKSDHEIVAVVTQPDKKRSRGGKLIPSPIKKLAELYAIPCLCPSKIKDNKDFLSTLREKDCDIFIVIAYGKILSQEILDLMKQFEINNMNTSNGKLVYSVTKTKEPLTRKSLVRTLNIYFNDNSEKANELSKFVMDNRKKIERVQLRRKINKK